MAIISRRLSYPGSFDTENDRGYLNWRLYGGGALIKVVDLAISTVFICVISKTWLIKRFMCKNTLIVFFNPLQSFRAILILFK